MPSGVYKRTPENTKNVGKSGKGKPAWNKGKPRTWKSGKDFEKGHEPWNKGRKRIRFGLDKQEFEAGRKKPESCEICGAMGVIYWDHDHETGKFRGWICWRCNVVLGHVRDDSELLINLAKYLK